MSTFKILLLSHLLADFPLQTNRIFRMKLMGGRGLALHVAIHLLVVIFFIPRFWNYLPVLAVLGITHFFTDWTKVRLQHPDDPQLVGFVIDQLVHLLVIGGIAWWQPAIPSILSDHLLVPAIILAVIPAVMMFGWVWATDLCQAKKMLDRKPIVWACRRLLPISQHVGWLVAFLVMGIGLILSV